MGKYRRYPTFSLKGRILGNPDYQWGKFMRLSLEKGSWAERMEKGARYAARKKLHKKLALETAIAGGRSWSMLDERWEDGVGWWRDWQFDAAIWLLRIAERWQKVWVREKLEEVLPKVFEVSRRTVAAGSVYPPDSRVDEVRHLVGQNEDAIAAMIADELSRICLSLSKPKERDESNWRRMALSLHFWRAVAHHNLH